MAELPSGPGREIDSEMLAADQVLRRPSASALDTELKDMPEDVLQGLEKPVVDHEGHKKSVQSIRKKPEGRLHFSNLRT